MSQSTDIEFSPQRLIQLAQITTSGDEDAMAKAGVTDMPSLVLEVTRLRNELFEKNSQLSATKRKLSEAQAMVEQLQGNQEAVYELAELRNKVASIASRAEKAERERDGMKRQLEAADARIQSLIRSITEISRAQGGEALVKEQARCNELEQENFELRERIARLERAAG